MEYALTEQQVNEFRNRGYLVLRQLMSTLEIKLILALAEVAYTDAVALAKVKALDEEMSAGTMFSLDMLGPNERSSACVQAIANADHTVAIRSISWIGGTQPRLIEFGRLPKVTIPVAQLLRSRNADHLINQIDYKIPGDNASFSWNQDLEHRLNLDPGWKDINGCGSFVKVITAVDEWNTSDGGLIIVPDSHHSFLELHKVETEREKEAIVSLKYDLKTQAIMLDLKPGDTVFMHPLLLDKGDVNRSRKSRKMFINGFSFPGANKRPYPGRGSAVPVDLGVPDAVDLSP